MSISKSSKRKQKQMEIFLTAEKYQLWVFSFDRNARVYKKQGHSPKKILKIGAKG
jgi:hypothetical protein